MVSNGASGAFLGIDLGTSGLKVALVDDGGALVAEGEAAYPVDAAYQGWAETDPTDWWTALTDVVNGMSDALRSTTVRGIGLAGQMHGVVLCDSAGNPLRPAVLWSDRRADGELSRWRDLPATDRARLANPIVPGMYGPVLGWLALHEPEVTARAEKALLPKDVLGAGLTGVLATDRSDASATLLWDVLDDDWARQVGRRTGVPERLLPDVVASDHVTGTTSWLAKLLDGGPDDVPVVAGAGDTAAAMLAAGGDAVLQVNLGTGAQVLLPSAQARPVESPLTHVYGDVDGGWYSMAAVQNAGLAVEWARRLLGLSWPDLVAILDAPARTRPDRLLPAVPDRRARRAGQPRQPWRLGRARPGHDPRGPGASGPRGDGVHGAPRHRAAARDGHVVRAGPAHRRRWSRARGPAARRGRRRHPGAARRRQERIGDRCRDARGAGRGPRPRAGAYVRADGGATSRRRGRRGVPALAEPVGSGRRLTVRRR